MWWEPRFWLILLLSFLVATPVSARAPRRLTAILFPEFSPITPRTLVRPPHYPEEDAFYKSFVAPLDSRIEKEYTEAWRFHETQIAYAATSWRHEYLQIGTTNYFDSTHYEWEVRAELAKRVMRLRVDSAMRAYFAPPERASLRNAHNAIQKLGDSRLSLSDDRAHGEIRIGYDVFSDESRLEYTRGDSFEAGIYHPRLMGSLTRTGDLVQLTRLQLRTRPFGDLPTATFVYHLGGMIETQLRQPLSSSLTTELIMIRSFAQSQISTSHLLRFLLEF